MTRHAVRCGFLLILSLMAGSRPVPALKTLATEDAIFRASDREWTAADATLKLIELSIGSADQDGVTTSEGFESDGPKRLPHAP